jgi:tetratricopeptide (TPR) repeat protein
MENRLIFQPIVKESSSLDIKIGCVCDRNSWGLLIKQQCFRAGFEDVTLLYQGLDSLKVEHNFDLPLIDESIDEHKSGGEVIDGLLALRKVMPTTAIVMVSKDSDHFNHNYDSPLMLLEFISTPFSEKELLEKVEVLAKSVTLLKPSLTFISNGKLSFAYKALNAISKTHITKDVVQSYFKLSVNLAFELGNFSQVVTICNKPNIKGQSWSLWPNFKANYELGNWGHYKQSLLDESFTDLPSGPIKLFWQLRILLQQQKFEDAIELVNEYPANEMPTTIVRLVFMILTFAGKINEAEEFIERKIRLAKPNSEILGQLTMSLCNIYLYGHLSSADTNDSKVLIKLNERLNSFKESSISKKFTIEINVIHILLAIINSKNKPEQIIKIKESLTKVGKLNNSQIINCRIAYAWYAIGEHDKAFNTLLDIDCSFGYMPLGCERLILGIVQTQIFNGIYPLEQRFDMYQKFGDKHLAQQRFKLACKSYVRALEIKHDDSLEIKLAKAMADADMKQFSGYTFNQA